MNPIHPDTFTATELGHATGCTCAPCAENRPVMNLDPQARLAGLFVTAVVRALLAQGGP